MSCSRRTWKGMGLKLPNRNEWRNYYAATLARDLFFVHKVRFNTLMVHAGTGFLSVINWTFRRKEEWNWFENPFSLRWSGASLFGALQLCHNCGNDSSLVDGPGTIQPWNLEREGSIFGDRTINRNRFPSWIDSGQRWKVCKGSRQNGNASSRDVLAEVRGRFWLQAIVINFFFANFNYHNQKNPTV